MAQNVFGELRKMGGVRPPREFVFMDRAAIGLGSVFIHLRASINWHQLFEGLIDGFDVDAPSIDAYGEGGFRVSGARHEGSLLIVRDAARPWPVTAASVSLAILSSNSANSRPVAPAHC